jgi:hypothetical protein
MPSLPSTGLEELLKENNMLPPFLKERLIQIILVALITFFFVIPLVALCIFDYKIFPNNQVPSNASSLKRDH